jgi:hypothetical protein
MDEISNGWQAISREACPLAGTLTELVIDSGKGYRRLNEVY